MANTKKQLVCEERDKKESGGEEKITQYNADTHNSRALTSMNARTQPYPYEHLRRLGRQILEIDEVTACASLSTEAGRDPICRVKAARWHVAMMLGRIPMACQKCIAIGQWRQRWAAFSSAILQSSQVAVSTMQFFVRLCLVGSRSFARNQAKN
uniref:Uncharacterized protein n=1 Tax=Oryza meridionalis TaxID=40149 RepID=A0A0E0DLJ7_9ORYZ